MRVTVTSILLVISLAAINYYVNDDSLSNVALSSDITTIANAENEAIVEVQVEQIAGENSKVDHLVVELTLVSEEKNKPFALDISLDCQHNECTDILKPQFDRYEIGLQTLFPALQPNEKRTLEIPLSKQETPLKIDSISIRLHPLVQGRDIGENAVEINSVTLKQYMP